MHKACLERMLRKLSMLSKCIRMLELEYVFNMYAHVIPYQLVWVSIESLLYGTLLLH